MLPGPNSFRIQSPLPQFGGAPRHRKNPLVSSKEQADSSNGDVVFPGPFSSAYSTIDTIPLDQAEDDHRQALKRIRDHRKNAIVIGQKAADAFDGGSKAGDFEIVSGNSESASYYSGE